MGDINKEDTRMDNYPQNAPFILGSLTYPRVLELACMLINHSLVSGRKPTVCWTSSLGWPINPSHSACPRASSPFLPSVRARSPSCPVGISLPEWHRCLPRHLAQIRASLGPSLLAGSGWLPGLVGSDSQVMLMILESLPIFLALVLCSAPLVSLQSFLPLSWPWSCHL